MHFYRTIFTTPLFHGVLFLTYFVSICILNHYRKNTFLKSAVSLPYCVLSVLALLSYWFLKNRHEPISTDVHITCLVVIYSYYTRCHIIHIIHRVIFISNFVFCDLSVHICLYFSSLCNLIH